MGNVTQYEDIAFAPRNYGLSKKEVDARVNHALDAIDIQFDGRTVDCARSAQSETADSIVKFFFSDKNYRVSRFGYDFEYL